MEYNGDIENISLDGYMFYGKEEHFRFHHCEKYMDGYHIGHFEMGYLERE